MGLLEPGLVVFLVSVGLTMTSPVSGSVFWGLTPLIVPILGRVVLGERIEIVVLVAAVIAFSGNLILVWGQSHHGGGSVLGDIFVASGVLASAVNALLSRRNAQAGAPRPAAWRPSCWSSCSRTALARSTPARSRSVFCSILAS
jgi:drug/metabolite transporter (DMT)-like permease